MKSYFINFQHGFSLIRKNLPILFLSAILPVIQLASGNIPTAGGVVVLLLTFFQITFIMTSPLLLSRSMEGNVITFSEILRETFGNMRRILFPLLTLGAFLLIGGTLLVLLGGRILGVHDQSSFQAFSKNFSQPLSMYSISLTVIICFINSLFFATAIYFSVAKRSFFKAISGAADFALSHILFSGVLFSILTFVSIALLAVPEKGVVASLITTITLQVINVWLTASMLIFYKKVNPVEESLSTSK